MKCPTCQARLQHLNKLGVNVDVCSRCKGGRLDAARV
ncbi:MAG: zf-TFIIB domain-containing protein [Candidatus Hydrogenedentes bacterium]|nr:zf-TFIIB domain-containing protein [Candidatus Hydrogenedentota bacterium]